MSEVQILSPQLLQLRTTAGACTEKFSSLPNDLDAMSSNQAYKISKIQSSASSTPIIPSSTVSKEQFMEQFIMFSHQQSTSSSSYEMEQVVPILPTDKGSRTELDHIPNESNANMNTDTVNPHSLNYDENQLSLERQNQIYLVPSQYDYDGIKYIIDQTMFYSDMTVPSYFSNMYDVAHQDDVINVGIDADEFFTFT
ncbi:3843_t:CDS:1 [Funneliformis caledonium]|uniref:3843_t:CDS:1 n=1 Tax=Funneliformis caledonium TaxID=1117310 RepID=A0A9N9CWS6_9GLOM|nr:3843_t:CDS:1 [Funneliformis caledonium]